MGISRKLAAFHLDKLVERGLLAHHFARPEGRTGPGAGRPAKFYQRSQMSVEVSVPERRYALAGSLLLQAVASHSPDETAAESTRQAARERGSDLGTEYASRTHLRRPGPERALTAAEEVLNDNGFEPFRPMPTEVALHNCPFHALAVQEPELVCGMNQAFIEGIVRGLGNETVEVALEPAPGHCCVRLRTPAR